MSTKRRNSSTVNIFKYEMAGLIVTSDQKLFDVSTLQQITGFTAINATYNLKARSRKLEKFLRRITCDDEDLLAFLQGALAQCLKPESSEQLYLLYGEGGGKSSIVRLMRTLLGDHAAVMPFEAICEKSKSDHCDYLKDLSKCRMVVIEEGEDSQPKISSGAIKSLVSGDSVLSRVLGGEECYMTPVTNLS